MSRFAEPNSHESERTLSDLSVLLNELSRDDGLARILVSDTGFILHLNAEAERLFGYSKHELLDKLLVTVIPERFREAHPALRRAFFGDPQNRPMEGRILPALCKDGTEVEVEIGLMPAKTEAGVFTLAVIRMASDR